MIHTIEQGSLDTYYEITVEVDYYFAGNAGCTSRLPEDCYPPEPADIDYTVKQIIAYRDEDEPITTTGDLELPESIDVSLFDSDLMARHEEILIEEAEGEY